MKKMMRAGAVGLVAATVAAGAWSQPLAVPPGQWWARPRVAAALALTPEQQAKLDQVAIDHARRMVDLKAAVDKAELEVRIAAETEPLDARQLRASFAQLQQARMRLETERLELLIGERELLSKEQWQRLRALAREFMEQRRDERRPDEGAPDGRRPKLPRRF